MWTLNGKAALVTGGGQGLGRGIALQLAKASAYVIVADVNEHNAESVAAEIQGMGGAASAVPLDVTDQASINDALREALSRIPALDILVNNAGVMQQAGGLETSLEDFDRCYQVNLKGAWQVTSTLVPNFRAQRNGKIVNIASIGGRRGWAETPAYGASKAALLNMTQSLALSLGPHNVNVNAVCPGPVETAMMKDVRRLFAPVRDRGVDRPRSVNTTPLERVTSADDVANAVIFLASELSRNITGQAINVDGGQLMN